MLHIYKILLTFYPLASITILCIQVSNLHPLQARPGSLTTPAKEQVAKESSPNHASFCLNFLTQLTSSQGNLDTISSLFAPTKVPQWRYRAAKKKLFAEVAPAAAEGQIEAIYTGQVQPSQGAKAPEGYNCEHLWPRAWMGGRHDPHFSQKESDLHNLFPSIMEVNSRRGHLPFGIVKASSTSIASPSLIGTGEGKGEFIEPRAERRGDIARALVYMAARWKMRWPSPHRDLLIEWSRLDPADEREKRRDEKIFALQGNRNPLIYCPEALPQLLELLKLP